MPWTGRSVSPDSIADCVLKTFDALPQKFKPRILDDGRREWVPLAGIVLTKEDPQAATASSMTCAALATGMKCLPQSKVALADGNIIHDWHAETLAIRAFNRWLIDECADLARKGFTGENPWVRWRLQCEHSSDTSFKVDGATSKLPFDCQPFTLKDNIGIHMYCSEAPCGDASMELTMANQDDPRPWTSQPATSENGTVIEMLGRGNFDHLGIVRRKPSRPDAPVTLSKSCSDKLALKQAIGLLSSPTALLLHPKNTYLSQLIMPESQCIQTSVDRAFGETGRMSSLAQTTWLGSGLAFTPFKVRATTREFAFSKRSIGKGAPIPSNLSAMYTTNRQEALINGVLQGRKQFDLKGASCVSRRLLWKSVLDVAILAGLSALATLLRQRTYADLKAVEPLAARERARGDAKSKALSNWPKNQGDENWGLEQQPS